MSEHLVTVSWNQQGDDFDFKRYSRNHQWDFPSGQSLSISAAAAYKGDASLPDPEAAFAGTLSSCHLLTFLAFASLKGLKVEAYEDNAVAVLGKNSNGKMAVVEVRLNPDVRFSGEAPDRETLLALHEKAHQECFIANSVNCSVTVNPVEA